MLCCRDQLDAERRDGLAEIVESGLDWQRLVRKATYHRLLGFVRHHLIGTGHLAGLPGDIAERLETTAADAAAGARCRQLALQVCDEALTAAGLSYLLLKGPSLQWLYPRGVVRVAGDLDLLVHEEDLNGVVGALGDCGFALATRTPPGLSPQEAVEFAQYVEQLRFLHPELGEIELHFRVYNYGVPDRLETSWERQHSWTVDDRHYPGLSPEDLFLYLAAHLNLHAFGRILWYYDLCAFYLRWRERLDWRLLAKRAEERGLTSSFYHTMHWILSILNPEVPATELDPLRPSAWRSNLFGQVWRKDEVLALESYIRPFDAARYYLLSSASPAQKIRYLARVLTPPPRWLGPYLERSPAFWLNWTYLRQRRRENRDWNRVTRRDELLS